MASFDFPFAHPHNVKIFKNLRRHVVLYKILTRISLMMKRDVILDLFVCRRICVSICLLVFSELQKLILRVWHLALYIQCMAQ